MKSQMNFCAHHHHPKPQTGKFGCGFGVWVFRNDPSTSPKRCHCISAWPCICSVINEGKIPVWAVPIPKPIWFVCGWEGRRDLEPPARSGTPERLGSMKEDLCKSAEKGNHYFGCLSIAKKKKKNPSPVWSLPTAPYIQYIEMYPRSLSQEILDHFQEEGITA